MTTITTSGKRNTVHSTGTRATMASFRILRNPDLSIETGANTDEFRIEFPWTTDMGELCYIESSVMVGFLDHHNLNTTANDLRALLAEANRTIEALRNEPSKCREAWRDGYEAGGHDLELGEHGMTPNPYR